MKKAFRILLALPGILFLIMGLRWLVDPAGAAQELGMPLLEGLGRSSQVGDMAAFFLTLGSSILLGVITLKRFWFYPGVMLLGLAAVSRTVSFLLHDAAFATEMIVFEVIIACLLWFGSGSICRTEAALADEDEAKPSV